MLKNDGVNIIGVNIIGKTDTIKNTFTCPTIPLAGP